MPGLLNEVSERTRLPMGLLITIGSLAVTGLVWLVTNVVTLTIHDAEHYKTEATEGARMEEVVHHQKEQDEKYQATLYELKQDQALTKQDLDYMRNALNDIHDSLRLGGSITLQQQPAPLPVVREHPRGPERSGSKGFR